MKNNWFYIALVVALAVSAILLWESPPKLLMPEEDPLDESKLPPYAVIEAAHSKHFDQAGDLSYEFSAETLKHFRLDMSKISVDDFTTMDQPLLTLYANDESWFISAKNGRVTDQGDLLKLTQDVRVWQEKSSGEILELTTAELLIYPNQKLIKTSESVTIRSPQGAIQAQGMVVDLTEKHIQLMSKVRGQHEPI